ncbi:MAG: hypothetical protein R3F59_01470 [Myxococcota bacterium]
MLHRELRLRDVPSVFATSAMQLGSLFLLIVIAISLNRFFVFEELPSAPPPGCSTGCTAPTSSCWPPTCSCSRSAGGYVLGDLTSLRCARGRDVRHPPGALLR